jgi:ElaB/YqjD/DUF883 family membrane-anchored ribosome-binding protein
LRISDCWVFEKSTRKSDRSGGAAVTENMKARLEQSATEVEEKAKEAVQNVREVRDTFADALSKSIESHPYTTLAIAGAIGLLIGAIWRR